MNSILLKIVAGLFSLFTIVYFGYQIYMMTYEPYPTETAYITSYTDQVQLQGIAIKSEQVVENIQAGVVSYQVSGAQKVTAGATVATIYPTNGDLLLGKEIEQAEQKLEILTELQSHGTDIYINAQQVITDLQDTQVAFADAVQQDDFVLANQVELELFSLLIQQELIVDQSFDLTAQIDAVNQEIATLQGQFTGQGQVVTVSEAGYFTSEVDGYETLVTPEMVQNLDDFTAAELTTLLSRAVQAPSGTIGKLIDSSEWYFLGFFDAKEMERVVPKTEITIRFPDNADSGVKVTVQEVLYEEGDDKAIVLLKSNNMNTKIVDVRQENPTLIFSESQGIRVPKEALRIVEQEEKDENGDTKIVAVPGVYVAIGKLVAFRKVDILYEGDNYVVTDINDSDPAYLQIYDEIILEGSDLYDGKSIR